MPIMRLTMSGRLLQVILGIEPKCIILRMKVSTGYNGSCCFLCKRGAGALFTFFLNLVVHLNPTRRIQMS